MSDTNTNDDEAVAAALIEDGPTRRRRQGAERLAASAPLVTGRELDDLDGQGGLTLDDARSVDLVTSLHQQGLARGLTPDQLADLRLGQDTPEFDAVVSAILDPPVAKKELLDDLFDAQVADAEEGAEPNEEVSPETAVADDDPHLALLNELSNLDDEAAQIEALTAILEDEDEAAKLLTSVADAPDQETQIELLRAAMEFVDSDPAEGDEVESLRLQNQMLTLAQTHPKGVEILKALAGAETLEEQGALLEAIAAGAPLPPVPPIDPNNPARPLMAGAPSALSADEMTEAVADALLANAGSGALSSSRRGSWG